MTATMNRRIENAKYALILMTTTKLADDRRALVPPVRKPATATIAEILAAKGVN